LPEAARTLCNQRSPGRDIDGHSLLGRLLKLLDILLRGEIEYLDADDVPLFAQIDDHAVFDLHGLCHPAFIDIQIGRVCDCVVIEFHGCLFIAKGSTR
jgi:hypothetical protein